MGVGQDHVRLILLQNWAVALNANVWIRTSSQHDSLVSRANIPLESIELIHVGLLKYLLPIPPRCFLSSFFFGQWLLQLDIILGAENAWQVNLLLEMLEEMSCWMLKFLQSLHNSRTRMTATV